MRLINPLPVTPAVLAMTNVPEDDAPLWDIATAYAVEDQVIYEHRVYEALIAHTGQQPNLVNDPPTWLDLGATNRYRAFDQAIEQQATNPGSLEYLLEPGVLVNAVAIFNADGSTAQVRVTDAIDGVVYDRTEPLVDDTLVIDWWAYFFEPIIARKDIAFIDLPQYAGVELEVIIDAGMGVAGVGEIVVGTQRRIGETNYGTSVGIDEKPLCSFQVLLLEFRN